MSETGKWHIENRLLNLIETRWACLTTSSYWKAVGGVGIAAECRPLPQVSSWPFTTILERVVPSSPCLEPVIMEPATDPVPFTVSSKVTSSHFRATLASKRFAGWNTPGHLPWNPVSHSIERNNRPQDLQIKIKTERSFYVSSHSQTWTDNLGKWSYFHLFC